MMEPMEILYWIIVDELIPVGSSIPFTVLPRNPVPFDSIVPVGCAPSQLRLNFKSSILCSSIAADGTDFVIEGPSNIRVQSAAGNCSDGNSFFIDITLSQPIVVGGDYSLRLVRGGDNNTLLDACGLGIPAGSSIVFNIKDTVSANFTYQLREGCITRYFHRQACRWKRGWISGFGFLTAFSKTEVQRADEDFQYTRSKKYSAHCW